MDKIIMTLGNKKTEEIIGIIMMIRTKIFVKGFE